MFCFFVLFCFFFQAEDGIRDRSPSRGLGDVYKRQVQVPLYLEKGLTKGMSVKITYRGELQSEDSDQESVEVVRIQNAD